MTNEDLRLELSRALAMWAKWHNPTSRKWVRACLQTIREDYFARRGG